MPQLTVVSRVFPVSLQSLLLSGGTWTASNSSNVAKQARTAGAGTAVVAFDIPAPMTDLQFGRRLKSVSVMFMASTADLTGAITVSLAKYNTSKAAVAPTTTIDATNIPVTLTGSGVTASANARLLTATVNTQAFDSTGAPASDTFNCIVSFPCAATTVLEIYGVTYQFDEIQG